MLRVVTEEIGERIWSSVHQQEEGLIQSVIIGNQIKLLELLRSGISPNSSDEVFHDTSLLEHY